MINECGAVGGKRTGRWNQITLRKPVPLPLCPPQGLTKTTTVGNCQLTI
jgi:hypothetical protein